MYCTTIAKDLMKTGANSVTIMGQNLDPGTTLEQFGHSLIDFGHL